MLPPPPININGVWKNSSETSCNIDGVWRSCKDKKQFTIKLYCYGRLYDTLTCYEGQSIRLPKAASNTLGWTTQTTKKSVDYIDFAAGNYITPSNNMILTEIYASTQYAEYTNVTLKYTKTCINGAFESGYVTGKASGSFTTQTADANSAYVSYSLDGGSNYLRSVTLGPLHTSRSVPIPALTADSGYVGVRSDSIYEIMLHANIWRYYTDGIL